MTIIMNITDFIGDIAYAVKENIGFVLMYTVFGAGVGYVVPGLSLLRLTTADQMIGLTTVDPAPGTLSPVAYAIGGALMAFAIGSACAYWLED